MAASMIAVQAVHGAGFRSGEAWLRRMGAMIGSVQELEMIGRRAFDQGEPIEGAAEPSAWRGVAKGQKGDPGLDAGSASADPPADGVMVEAAVKWFNATKGYGFVELSGGAGDAFLHLKTLRETGRQTLPSGAKIRVVVRDGSRGAEVVRVIEVDTRSASERSSRRSTFDPSAAFDLTGKVKWFDDARGFGFVASDDFGKDVFVHSSTLGVAGIRSLVEGQAVSMRVVETPKGREAIAILV
jgi:CspA family cold shock protein